MVQIKMDFHCFCSSTAMWSSSLHEGQMTKYICDLIYNMVHNHSPCEPSHNHVSRRINVCVLGDVFQTGISPVVYSASDAAGNRAECDFNVFLRSKSMFLF